MDVVEQAVERSRIAGRSAKLTRMAVLQHVPFEGPAAIADWAKERGVPITIAHLYAGERLPELASFDMLTVMGGPMSANDEAKLDWLNPEIALVRQAMDGGKIVFGVCLGAQIIAKASGARVYGGRHKEIGWFPVQKTSADHPAFADIPATFTPLHWHGETFDLPYGAHRLAQTVATPNQAFAIGGRVLGLQFHMEATPESVSELVESEAGEIGPGDFEQPPGAILACISNCAAIRPLLDRVLDNLTGYACAGK